MVGRKLILLISALSLLQAQEIDRTPFEATRQLCNTLSEKVVYVGLAATLGTVSCLAKLGWCISFTSPLAKQMREESFLLSQICNSVAKQMVWHALNSSSFSNKGIPLSHTSWHRNRQLLRQIPISSQEDQQLLQFLEKRWLAKSTGFFTSVVHWICPSFGVTLQVHPDTTSHYARNPWNKFSKTYTKRVEMWKKRLPHPHHFPLILTRPCDIRAYLPACTDSLEELQTFKHHRKVVVDVTGMEWDRDQSRVLKACAEAGVKPRRLICIQRVFQDGIGGVRLLPFDASSKHRVRRHHRFLLKWISTCGLAANLIELDQCPPLHPCAVSINTGVKKIEFSTSDHPQKQFMLQGTHRLVEGLSRYIPERKLATLSLSRIQEQFHKEEDSFFDTMAGLEEVHANLSSLLTVLAPYHSCDFPPIYRTCLPLPSALKNLTECTVHASGMTSLTGIVKAVEVQLGRRPHVLYGENAYFECIQLVQKFSQARCMLDAKAEDWDAVDLIVAEFNPSLRRIELTVTDYRVENVAEAVRLALRPGKRLTLALDCTLDYIASPRLAQLLEEFEHEIVEGRLNVVGYRSGIKFDLFGMDNYAGAPLFMIHNKEDAWKPFDRLTTDPALQTDLLSLNWFCLAYQHAALQLDQYRAQIFRNTHDLLAQIPATLFNKEGDYRVVPMEPSADAAFLDIKISGPLHQLRGATLVGGCLYTTCMQRGHPIFYRPSLGFYHPNFTMIFGQDTTTIRLTLGLDPEQVGVLAECFRRIDRLNCSL